MDLSMQSPSSVRSLPPNSLSIVKKLTNSTLEDHYVAFILYCNPTLPSNLSTTELRKVFRSVPRTDGKSFETLTIFHLVSKLEKGEINTWNQLVTELGVEPPDIAKGGSSQKLQQYAVRLKRWCHASHIDALFQYLLGNGHPYFTQIRGGPDTLYQARDGVSLEDDLALRALLPNLRPKRGRRKGYDDDNDSIDTPNKRLRGGTPSTVDGRNSPRPDPWGRVSQSPAPSYVPHFPATHATQTLSESSRSRQTPVQGHEDHLNELFASASRALSGNNGRNTVSSSSTTTIQNNPQQLQQLNSWPHSNGRSHNEYPQSAIDLHAPSNAFGSPEMNDGSRSAHPSAAASTAKSKRRGGSGVSAAWTGQFQNVAAGGPKIRGRPPQNRNVKNGPFEIWSVKESIENDRDDGQTNYYPTNMTNAGPQAAVAQMHQGNPNVTTSSQTRRLPTKKLSLTVPPQPGGNIRLATPPVLREQAKSTETTPLPRVTLNDDKSLSRSQSLISKTRERESVKERERQRTRLFADDRNRGRSSADFFNTIDEEASQNDEYDEYKHDSYDNDSRDGGAIDWKQRAYTLAKKLKQSQDELRRIKKAVLEAVM